VTPPEESLVRAAARNNAEWCESVSRSHGLVSRFGPRAWTAPARTPLFYPDAVTLEPGADAEALLAGIDMAASGASVKDSFADLDLSGAGFHVLFAAQWFHRPPGAPASASGLRLQRADTPDALREWANAWDDREGHADLFRPELLEDPAVFVLSGTSAEGRVVAGAVANRSGDVVGVSNVFALESDTEAAWPFVLEAVHRLFPALPVVGYEHGEDLEAAMRHGCSPIGPLRVWAHD